jgi:hypothetical protein
MNRLFIIGSIHESNDWVTSEALTEIIRRIKPDVIFEEIPQDMFEDIYERRKYPDVLEVTAVRSYIADGVNVKHFPVDIPYLPEIARKGEFNRIEKRIEEIIEKNPGQHKEIEQIKRIDKRIQEIESVSFEAINSRVYREGVKKRKKIQERVMKKYYPELFFGNKYEHDFHYIIRENYMVYRIASLMNEYQNGLLIVGSSHCQSMYRKLQKQFKRKVQIIKYNKRCLTSSST